MPRPPDTTVGRLCLWLDRHGMATMASCDTWDDRGELTTIEVAYLPVPCSADYASEILAQMGARLTAQLPLW